MPRARRKNTRAIPKTRSLFIIVLLFPFPFHGMPSLGFSLPWLCSRSRKADVGRQALIRTTHQPTTLCSSWRCLQWMSKYISSRPLALQKRAPDTTLTRWLYQELRRAILDRRLLPGTQLPATRDFALQYGVSRGTVVTVFEQLQAEGYLIGRVGAGTRINERLSQDVFRRPAPQPRIRKLPAPIRGLSTSRPAHPFRPYEPALTEFPVEIWARVAGRRLRRASSSLLAGGDPRGYAPLREAIAAYLGSSRGVNCSADSVVIVSGVQQGLDLIARLLIKPGEAVWVEDPGYFGAIAAFHQAGARIIPVPVDEAGLSVSQGEKLYKAAKAADLTA